MDSNPSVDEADDLANRDEPTNWRHRWLPGALAVGGSTLAAISVFHLDWAGAGSAVDYCAHRAFTRELPDGGVVLLFSFVGVLAGLGLLQRVTRRRGAAAFTVGPLLIGMSVWYALAENRCGDADTLSPGPWAVSLGAVIITWGGVTAWRHPGVSSAHATARRSFSFGDAVLLLLASMVALVALYLKVGLWTGRLWSEHDSLLCQDFYGEVQISWATRIGGVLIAVVTFFVTGLRFRNTDEGAGLHGVQAGVAVLTIAIALLPTILFWGQPVDCYT